ncbi:MAG: nucleotidyltransferase domain-containing protein [Pseudomonadota bacterium]
MINMVGMKFFHTCKKTKTGFAVNFLSNELPLSVLLRNDYTDGSDVDLIIRFRSGTERIHDLKQQLREELELVFGRPVQLASEKYLKPYFLQQILKDAMNV